jgi:hypothetical protein
MPRHKKEPTPTGRQDNAPALLPCEGRCTTPDVTRATWHTYMGGQPLGNRLGTTSMAVLYSCDTCGRARRWGWEEARTWTGPIVGQRASA